MTSRTAVIAMVACMLFLVAGTQSASAVSAKNITVAFCEKGVGDKDFSDPHCDSKVQPDKGEFGHQEVSLSPLELLLLNAGTKDSTTESTPAVLKGTIFGVKAEISCKTVTGKGEIQNKEPSKGVHLAELLNLLFGWEGCTVLKPALGCKVKQPIEFNLKGEAVEGLGPAKNTMGLEFRPAVGETFGEFTLEGCFVAGTYKLTGTAIGTGSPSPTAKHSGATNVLTPEMTKETLKLAGNPAEISSVTTEKSLTTNTPIAFTTPT
jgi:hypothetical protein